MTYSCIAADIDILVRAGSSTLLRHCYASLFEVLLMGDHPALVLGSFFLYFYRIAFSRKDILGESDNCT
jgi:hypothetical protein